MGFSKKENNISEQYEKKMALSEVHAVYLAHITRSSDLWEIVAMRSLRSLCVHVMFFWLSFFCLTQRHHTCLSTRTFKDRAFRSPIAKCLLFFVVFVFVLLVVYHEGLWFHYSEQRGSGARCQCFGCLALRRKRVHFVERTVLTS